MASMRDRPDIDGMSRLSPHLAWGEISVHEIWRRVTRTGRRPGMGFLREWAGGISTRTCSTISGICRPSRNASFKRFPFVVAVGAEGLAAAGPAFRWSMPACASFGVPAGCIIGCEWSVHSW